MHISLSFPVLIIIVVVLIALLLFLRFGVMRGIVPGARRPTKIRTRRPPSSSAKNAKSRSPRFSVSRKKWSWWGGKPSRSDKGALVAKKYGVARSPLWPAVAKEHLLHQPACAACGYEGKGLQVHHIQPFHLAPQLELDPKNLITLCEIKGRDHHLLVGHLDDWESYNVNVRRDVVRFHGENARKIRSDSTWQKEVQNRPLPEGESPAHRGAGSI